MNQPQNTPFYLELVEQIRSLIREQRLQPGDRVPSERALAKELGAAPMTVRRALAVLVEEGLVVKQPARGTFVAEVPAPAATPVHDDVLQTPAALPYLKPTAKREVTLEIQDSLPNQLRFWDEAIACFQEENPDIRVSRTSEQPHRKPDGLPEIGDVVFLPQYSLARYRDAGLIRPFAKPHTGDHTAECYSATLDFGAPFSATASLFMVNTELACAMKVQLPMDYHQMLTAIADADANLAAECLLAVTVLFPISVVASESIETNAGRESLPERIEPLLQELTALGDKVRSRMWDRRVPFSRGDIAIIETTTAIAPTILKNAAIPVSVQSSPRLFGQTPRYTPCVLALSARSEEPDAAEELARFMASERAQQLLMEHAYGIPARQSLLTERDPNESERIAALQRIVRDGTGYGVSVPSVPEFCSTICMPLCAAMINREIPVAEGLQKMRELTTRFHAGTFGWGYPDLDYLNK